ncbi:hypothetical protein I4F81_011686 [Pyropia yezoensis]|uniref:Uncharacterized protein n=1 Tax=Pyropia yezoensis TaxID=2788 RepID=A0ACC3CG75_PYRYE|nr:hypothetical protein I4F81_011686 [Neopyropia yezoensis]
MGAGGGRPRRGPPPRRLLVHHPRPGARRRRVAGAPRGAGRRAARLEPAGGVLDQRVPPLPPGTAPPYFVPIPVGVVNWTASSSGAGGAPNTFVSTAGETEVVVGLEGGGTSGPSSCGATLLVRLQSLAPACPVRCIDASGDCGGRQGGGLVQPVARVPSAKPASAAVATTAAPSQQAGTPGRRRAAVSALTRAAPQSDAVGVMARQRSTLPLASLPAPEARVVGGRPLGLPEQRLLVFMVDANGSVCSGSVISATHVLTAAHCAVAVSSTVYVGGSGASASARGTPHTVSRFVPHPLFTLDTGLHDVAVVELATPVRSPAGEVPVMVLPRPGTGPLVGSYARAAGYGKVDENLLLDPVDAALLSVDIPVLAKPVCLAARRRAAAGAPLTDLDARIGNPVLLCAGYLDGGCDTCAGDSGGPLYQTVTRVVAGMEVPSTVQVGVTSCGDGCANVDQPGVYTLVAPHTDWIEGVMASGSAAGDGVNGGGGQGEGSAGSATGGNGGGAGGVTPGRLTGSVPVGAPDGGGADAAGPPANGSSPAPDGGVAGRAPPDAGAGGGDTSGGDSGSSIGSNDGGGAAWWVIALSAGCAILGVTAVVVAGVLLHRRQQAKGSSLRPSGGDP